MMSGRNFLRAVPRAVSRRALNFNLSEDSLALQEVARKFAREEMLPKAAHYDKTMEYPQDIFTAAWELGLGKLFLNSPQRESLLGSGIGTLWGRAFLYKGVIIFLRIFHFICSKFDKSGVYWSSRIKVYK